MNSQQGIARKTAVPTVGPLLNWGNPDLPHRQQNTELKGIKFCYEGGAKVISEEYTLEFRHLPIAASSCLPKPKRQSLCGLPITD